MWKKMGGNNEYKREKMKNRSRMNGKRLSQRIFNILRQTPSEICTRTHAYTCVLINKVVIHSECWLEECDNKFYIFCSGCFWFLTHNWSDGDGKPRLLVSHFISFTKCSGGCSKGIEGTKILANLEMDI